MKLNIRFPWDAHRINGVTENRLLWRFALKSDAMEATFVIMDSI